MNVLARLIAAPLRWWVRTYADIHDRHELADAAHRLAAEADQASNPEEAALMRAAAQALTCAGAHR